MRNEPVNKPVCPMMLAAGSGIDRPCQCLEDGCSWWSFIHHECAVVTIARAQEDLAEVAVTSLEAN